MSACVVWIDSQRARVFKISAEGIQKKMMKQHAVQSVGAHHDNHKHNSDEHFFQDVATFVGSPDELLVFGSGKAKNHFKNHLEKHNRNDLARHLVGVETLGNLSDNQILEAARKFFKKFSTYNAV